MIAHLPFKKYWLRLMLALTGTLLLAACNQPAPPTANTGVYKIRIECTRRRVSPRPRSESLGWRPLISRPIAWL